MADNQKIVMFAIAGVGLWWLYEQGYLASWFGPSFGPTATPTTPPSTPPGSGSGSGGSNNPPSNPPSNPPAQTKTSPPSTPPSNSPPALTVADAAQYPYSTAVTAAQMNAIHGQLVTELQGGQIPSIAGNSVLAFMLGWGGASNGATQTVLGDTYKFDGSNWNLEGSAGGAGMGIFGYPGLGLVSSRVPRNLLATTGYRIKTVF